MLLLLPTCACVSTYTYICIKPCFYDFWHYHPSPLLFSLFLSDLDSFMTVHNNCKGVRLLEQTVNSLMFADDLVIFSDTNKDLQHSLSVLEAYCSSWDLRVNATKSKVLIFNVSRHQSATTYQFNINNITQYGSTVYIGIAMVDPH